MTGNNGESRLDRMERIMEGLVDAHMWLEQSQKNLFRSHVLLTDSHEQTEKQLNKLAESQQRLAEAEHRMDDALTALMGTVDEIIKSRKQ